MPGFWKSSSGKHFFLGISGLLIFSSFLWFARPRATQAAPELTVYTSPIQAGCYLATRSTCRIQMEPFTINKSGDAGLVGFQLKANGSLIYDFKTDMSNPPKRSFAPSAVKMGFAAACGKTYTISLGARDTDDPDYLILGQVEDVVCPQGVHEAFLPLITR